MERLKAQEPSVEVQAKNDAVEASIARLYEQVQLVSERDFSVEVRALIEDAEAKLARLNAQAASLDR